MKTPLSEKVSLLGDERGGCLEETELHLFMECGIILPETNQLYFYRRILLVEVNRIVTAEASSRATKRINSCIKYKSLDGTVRYGLLQKLVKITLEVYAILIALDPDTSIYEGPPSFIKHYHPFHSPK